MVNKDFEGSKNFEGRFEENFRVGIRLRCKIILKNPEKQFLLIISVRLSQCFKYIIYIIYMYITQYQKVASKLQVKLHQSEV